MLRALRYPLLAFGMFIGGIYMLAREYERLDRELTVANAELHVRHVPDA